MSGPDCSNCEDVSAIVKRSDKESAASSSEIAETVEKVKLAGYRGGGGVEGDTCAAARRGELHLTPLIWEEILEVPYRDEDIYDFVEGILVSRAGAMADGEHQDMISRW